MLAEAEIQEFARTRTTDPSIVLERLVWMSQFHTRTDTFHVHRRTTHPPSPPRPCVACVVVAKQSYLPRKPANIPRGPSTPKETHVRTISNIILESDVTVHMMTKILQRGKCVVDVNLQLHQVHVRNLILKHQPLTPKHSNINIIRYGSGTTRERFGGKVMLK